MAQQPGQISPDGLWRWDGQRWVPTGAMAPQQQAPMRPRGSLAWLWWLGGGCALLIVVAVVAGIFGLTGLVRNFQGGAYSCLPADFPSYPGASVVRENSTVGTHNECDMTLSSNDDVGTVTRFYATRLNQGDWQDTVDVVNGVVTFKQVSGGHATGQVQLLGAGQHTEIRISLVT
jgi:hypothetical protein